MSWFKSKRMVVTLALAVVPLAPVSASAQSGSTIPITIDDSSGAPVAGATVFNSSGKLVGRTDASGKLDAACATPCSLRITARGFSEKSLQASFGTVIRLDPAGSSELVTVNAYRTPMGSLESPVATRQLSQEALDTTAAVSLDGGLRQLPGVELFRRSSSLVANPSSQGISLRALGSTSASRTLVTQDDVPLNDAFAGTIHWLEQPELAIQSIELMRGGASDLYGSSAIGGVVSLVPLRPVTDQVELLSSFGGEGTYDESLMLQTKRGPWGLLAAGGALGTDGYIQEAPTQRGPVDIASNVHSQNASALAEHDRGGLRLFVRGSGFNEARNNGTPFQTNGTRLWRYATGADWQGAHAASLVTRLYGATDHFRQTFSSISNLSSATDPSCSYRCGETPTKFSLTPDNELGAVAHWNQPLGTGLLLVVGADAHDVRVWDREQSLGTSTALTNLHDHQRDSAAYAEAMWVRKAWTLVASGRFDWFQNYDGQQLLWNGTKWTPSSSQPPQFDQRFFDPRLGLSRKLLNHWAISASGFRAFRAPTPNELYRSTQVGNKLTSPNGSLLSEQATGWETGLATEHRWGSVRTGYFLTQVDRPITAVTTNPTSSPILLKRENLGQIASRGVSVDFELKPLAWLAVDGGYQYARATVTQGTQDLGNWIPEVARNLSSLNVRAFRPRLGTLNLQSRLSGRQFDDDANTYLLHGYFRLDAYASHDFGKRLQLFTAGENLFNRQIEVSKTPTTTLAMPRVARVGFQMQIGRTEK
jgi:outer membrane receptor protein involved in Fe transport